MRHSQDCLGAGEPCCYGSLAPDDAFAHPVPPPSAAHAALLAEAEDEHIEEHTLADYPQPPTKRCEFVSCKLARALRAASPSPVPEAATLADDLEKLSMTLPPVCDRERDAIKALAKRVRCAFPVNTVEVFQCHCGREIRMRYHAPASPSPGAVEAAYREGYRAGWHEGYNGGSSLPRAAMTNGEDRSWQASAARRGAAGGQDG